MGFKEFLLSGAKLLRTSLGIPIPVEDLLRGLFSLIEKVDQLEEDEVLKVALYWALYKAVEDSLKELTENTAPLEELREPIKNLFRELDKKLTELGNKRELFELSKFSLANLYENEAVKEILNILDGVAEQTFKPIEDFPVERFKGLVKNRFKLFFWIVIEEDENRFRKLWDNLNKESSREKLKEYYIHRHLSKIVKEFAFDPIFGDENEIPLEKVYVEPHYGEYNRNDFKRIEKSILEELYPDLQEGKNRLILILGFPGEGKTSLARKIVYDFKTHWLNISKNIYLLKLRDVEDPEELLKGNPKSIKQELERLIFGDGENFQLEDFKNSIVILDGLDELLMTKNYLSDKGEEFIKQLLKFLRHQSQWRNLQIIITSRLGYVEPWSLYRLEGLKLLKLEGFNLEQQKEWIEKYSQYHPDKGHYLQQIEQIPQETRELLSQPILLYIAVSSGVDLSKIQSKIDIYEALLDAVVEKKWDEIKGHPNLGDIDKEQFKELIGFLAFLIFKKKESIYTAPNCGKKRSL